MTIDNGKRVPLVIAGNGPCRIELETRGGWTWFTLALPVAKIVKTSETLSQSQENQRA